MDMITEKQKYQLYLIVVLVGLAFFFFYYFENVLKTGELYTHFFYIPIILSCIWWKKKGLYVTGTLLAALVPCRLLCFRQPMGADDWGRAFMIAFISLITIVLSEALSAARKELKASETRYRTIFEATGTAMAMIEENSVISLVNSQFETLSGYSKPEVENRKSFLDFLPEEKRQTIEADHPYRSTASDRLPKKYQSPFLTKTGERRDILLTVDSIPETLKSVASFADVTEMKQTLKRQKELEAELSATLARVLSGYIPICANCKRIRDENDNWVDIESFLSRKTAADFSHGICPRCAAKLYADFLPREKQSC